MKTEYLVLGGVAALLLLNSRKTANPTATPAATTIPNANAPVRTPGDVLDQVVNSVRTGDLGGLVSVIPDAGRAVGITAAGSSFDPANPGENRAAHPLTYRVGISSVSAGAASVGIPGSVPPPAPARRVKGPSGVVPYSPFGGAAGRMLSIM